MSLIEQALRRAQDPVLSQPASPPVAAPPRAEEPAPAHSWLPGASGPVDRLPRPRAASSRMVALAAIVGGLALLWAWRAAGRVSRPTAVPAPPKTDAATPSGELPDAARGEPSPVKKRALWPLTQDPWVVSGVIEGSGAPYALLNGRIVGIGDRIEGLTVRGIGQGAVTLERPDGRQLTLRVSP